MFNFLCKIFKHNFKYIRRYYRCTRCGVRKYELSRARQERMMKEQLKGLGCKSLEKTIETPKKDNGGS